ncbi:MAG: hypothetical protein IIB17_03670, partial [Chloroflexi bacterium]|nr:hypothetical protein [Chloroflexota bacterium]
MTVTFTPSETDFDELHWDFGDGETLTSRPGDGPVSHTFITIGTHTVTVAGLNRDSNRTGESASVTVSATPGILDNFSLSPDSLTILPEGAASFNVSAFDQFGNPLPNAKASYTVSDSAGTIDEEGNFTASQNAGTYPDSLTVGVALDGVSLDTRTMIVIRPGPLSQIILEPQSVSTTPSGQLSFSTLAIDEFGNPLSNIQITFKADIAAGQIDGAGAFTAGTRAGAYVRAVVVEATDGSNTASAQAHVRIDPGPLAQLLLLPNTPTVRAGGEVRFTASALDRWGNALEGLNIQFDKNSSAGRINPHGDFVAAGLAGVFRDAVNVEALAGGISLSASTDVIVTHGPLDHVLIAPTAAEVRAAETTSFTARASDAFGNEIEGAQITWKGSGSAGTIDNRGILTAGAPAGFYPNSVVASARFDGVSVESSASVLVTPGPLSLVSAAAGLIQINAGEIVQLESPRAFDRHGNNIPGAIVIWSIRDANAGEVSPSGLFAASEAAGEYPDALQARISKEGDIRSTAV